MKGSVKKRGNLWMYVVDLPRTDDGKRKQKKKGGFKTRKEAESELAQILADLERGQYLEPSKVTFGQYITEWITDKKTTIREGTLRKYDWLIRTHIIPNLGQVELSKLTPMHLQKFYTKLQTQEEPLSNRSILHAHRIIQQALDRAVKWSIVPKNVATAVDPPKPKKVDFKVWNADEVTDFLSVAKSHRYYIAFLLAITTGMRKGEILALRWKDIDLDKAIISVLQTYSYTGESGKNAWKVEDTKTGNGKRAIAIPEQVIDELKKHKIVQAKEKLKAGSIYKDNDLIVAKEDGDYVTGNSLDKIWYKLRDAAGVSKIRFHDLRHTHASLMLLQGVHPKIVSERLGHSSIGITLDTYSHVLPGLQESAAAQFADAIFGTEKIKNKS